MESAFGVVLFVVVFLGAIAAVISFLGSSELYDKIGRGGMSLNEDREDQRKRSSTDSRSSTVAAAERDDEIRQLLRPATSGARAGGRRRSTSRPNCSA
jgi:hypothetical protein